jgi:hypothetical protein
VQIVYVSRAEWGATQATENFIRNRFSATPAEKTTIQVHHTARPDDGTPNRWDYPDAERYMRSLQTARPELGPLPYSMNLAVSEDAQTVWVFEGRGILKVGAHTAGHNRDGVGYGIFGNFDLRDDVAALVAIGAIEQDVVLRRGEGLLNLGEEKNPRGWNAWGHRDSSPKSCPGNHLYPLLANFSLDPGDDMDIETVRALALEPIIQALQRQKVAWYQALQAATGVPGGNAAYWGIDYTGTPKPTLAEWQAEAVKIHAAALSVGASGVVDSVARADAADARALALKAQQGADKANTDLGQIKSVIG